MNELIICLSPTAPGVKCSDPREQTSCLLGFPVDTAIARASQTVFHRVNKDRRRKTATGMSVVNQRRESWVTECQAVFFPTELLAPYCVNICCGFSKGGDCVS